LETLRDLIEGRAELLARSMWRAAGELYAVNVPRVSDALNEEASELKRFPHVPSCQGRLRIDPVAPVEN
jgi:hypothetical protein